MREFRSLRLVACLLWLLPALALGQTLSNQQVLSELGGAYNRTTIESGASITPSVFTYLPIDVRRYGAKFNVVSTGSSGTTPCSISSGSNVLTCPSASFTAADVGKAIAVTGAGTNAQTTLTTTIASFISSTQVGLAANAGTTTPVVFCQAVAIEPAVGSGYVPADTVTPNGGTFSVACLFTVRSTQVHTVAINAAGSGAVNGACTIFGTTGSPTNAHFAAAVTITGGALSSIGTVSTPGYYTTNPTSLAAEPVTSNCGLTSATVTLTMGTNVVAVTTNGTGTVAPCGATPCASVVSQSSTSGVGSGATFQTQYLSSGDVTYGTDDTAAWNSAIAVVNRSYTTSSARTCIVAPQGVSWVTPPLTIFSGPGCILGAASGYKTTLYISPSGTGDIFSWSEAWFLNDWPFNGITTSISTQRVGPTVIGIAAIGDRSSPNDVTLFHLYDRDDYVYLDEIDASNIKGQCFKDGDQKNTTQAFIRESYFGEIRCYQSGDSANSKAAWELYASGNGTGGTPIDCDNLNIYAPYGDGLYIHSDATGGPLRGIHCKHFRVEGLENNSPGLTGHLLHLGNAAALGTINGIHILDAQFISPYNGYSDVFVDGASTATAPYDVYIEGSYLGATAEGGGINLNACRQCYFLIDSMFSTQTNLTVASSATVAAPIIIDGHGLESTFTTNIDATTAAAVYTPLRTALTSAGNGIGLFANVNHLSLKCQGNNTTTCGNPIGANAVDLQTAALSNAGQVASGGNAFAAGAQNVASGTFAAAVGNNNSITGVNGIGLGFQSADRTRYQALCTAAGKFVAQGDAQDCVILMRQTTAGASAVRLTSDAAAAGAANCVNVPNNTAYALTINVNAWDHTTVTKSASWNVIPAFLTRGANAAATALNITSSTPAATFSNGTLTGMALSITADTTQGCLNVSFTPPTGNTDTWNIVASVQTQETQ